jgi:3-oxoacyl-[acyl-carrier protein] reductase
LANEGADLYLSAKEDQNGLEKALAEIRALGMRAKGGLYDASKVEDVERLMEDLQRHFETLDILINNAGIIKPMPLWEISSEQFERTLRTHLFGTFYHMQAAIKRFMMPKKSGKIINLAAPAALRGSFGVADYATAKGGIIALTKNAAKELIPFNIQVNAIVPVAETRMTKALLGYYNQQFGEHEGQILKGLSKADKLIGTFVYFASSDSDYVTGQVLAADGGMLC